MFADADFMTVEHADYNGIKCLVLVIGGEIVPKFGNPELLKLGCCMNLLKRFTIFTFLF
jgi:T-complex protein 1 subunit beta